MQLKNAGVPPPFLKVEEGGYLIEILSEAGPVKSSPLGGAEPLDWADIDSYARLTSQDLEPWEARLIRSMSIAYVRGLNEGKSPFSIAPVERGREA